MLVPLPDLPENHPTFLKAYAEAGNAKPKGRQPEGTIAALIVAYLGSPEYKRMATSTQATWRRTLDRISEQRGQALVKHLRIDHLRKDIRAFTPGAQQNRIKAWRSILKFAVEEGQIASDPSFGLKAQIGEVRPHRQWTQSEIETFRSQWPMTTAERRAFEVIYWTGARCVDAVRLGWQMVGQDGWLRFVQAKTDGPATCPVRHLPTWAEAMSTDHAQFLVALPQTGMIWIAKGNGAARSVKALSQWVSKSAKSAGLPDDCTAHGLRKARAAALAEAGATSSQIGAWTGHASLSEISHYTKQADQMKILSMERNEKAGNRSQIVSKTDT
ncbi:putative tyrosine recombinase [Ketogulonicigenium robustum]|uniref:Putative tyrosine recombinase n=1 Tax=Ketogulonicigenium robustum TaxID=92947 RepID=A0A1W6NZE4_9RHOB|nr:tyrosine-type recombinase/integrase [Ketogulonicigenium robustum]ARO14397.1 putative tyrosine recombinase [Ketogulonicigenium robustum]